MQWMPTNFASCEYGCAIVFDEMVVFKHRQA